MALSDRLKHHTAIEHQKTENSPQMLSLLNDNFSKQHYEQLLQRFWIFYDSIEKSLLHFLAHHNIQYEYTTKTPLLEQDLRLLGCNIFESITKGWSTPDIENTSNFLGVLYVIEGSTLGGMVIKKKLQNNHNIKGIDHFFYPYQDETKIRWVKTKAFIDSYTNDERINEKEVTTTATATFKSIRRSLNAND